jgi:hypothetical protein
MCVTIDRDGLVTDFIDHLYARLIIASNYSATSNLHKSLLQTLSFVQSAVALLVVSW